jgi:putative ABC transport system permease protein
MTGMNDGRRRYADVPRSPARIETDVDDELRFDLDMRVGELVAEGMTEGAARARATMEFGDLEATRRYCAELDARQERTARIRGVFEDLISDVGLAWRGMRKSAAFAAVVLLTLAIGLGVNVAIYSVVRRVLIDRLPYRAAGELVRIYAGVPPTGGNDFVTPAELRDLATAPSIAAIGAFGGIGSTVYYGEHEAIEIQSAQVTPNFFTVLGATAAVGRTFGDGDVGPGAPRAVMLSYDTWQQTFNADPKIVGRSIDIVGGAATVVGVMPREFVSPGFNAGLWTPVNLRGWADSPKWRDARAFRGIARLRPGATLARATADADIIASRWRRDGLIKASNPSPRMESLRDAMVGDVRPALLAVMVAALLVLVITCTNVAGLFLARATARRRELAVRVALGAGRGRLIRQLLTETTLYGLLGGVGGLVVALVTQPVLVRAATDALPNLGPIVIDPRLVATALATSLICGAAFGTMPAISATRVDLRESMGDGGRGASVGGERFRARQSLVATQIALAALLMVAAGVLLRSFNHLINTDVGYTTDDRVLIFTINTAQADGDQNARNVAVSNAIARVRALPGVEKVGVTRLGPWNGPDGLSIRRENSVRTDEAFRADYISASDDYFAAAGTRIMRGRAIQPTDRPGAPRVALISQSAAKRLFGADDPIGRRVYIDTTLHEVVGVVGDVLEYATSDPIATVYVSDWQANRSAWVEFLVRTHGDARTIMPALRQLVHEINPRSPIMFARTLKEVTRMHLAPQQLSLMLFALFALLAVTLAALGVYGVLSYVVATRTREFGIRSALGARRGALMALVFRWGMTSAVAGGVVGISAALSGVGLLSKLVVGVSTRDPLTFVVVPATLVIVTLVACGVPAWRATRVDPVEALRAE